MARKRPKDSELIAKLMGFPKPYFTVADLEKILGLKRESLYVTLTRLVRAGILVRLRKNAYKLFLAETDVEKVANELYFPSYLSFESALSAYGILSQIPYTLTFATSRPSKRMVVRDTEVEYRHLKGDLFLGYTFEHGKYIATPEKALMDELYLMSRGKTKIDIEELDLREIDRSLLEEYASKFPGYMSKLVTRVEDYIGTTPATLETKERIEWKEPVVA
jgi:predicted transcriptional regulator of viral defense system